MRVAIVCDWLTGVGGAERVVLELHRLYPDAPIYTSQYDPRALDWFRTADVRTGWLQKLPRATRKFLPVLRAWYFSHLDLNGYDLVISSSGAEAKGVKTGLQTVHINYCHSPTHYYWRRFEDYLKNPGFGALDWLARLGLKLLVGPMRRWDRRAAQRPNYMIANSTYTQTEIKKYYGRESTVIFPPVDIQRFAKLQRVKRHGFLVVGRQAPYKGIELAVAACTELGLPLTVVGDGPLHEKLVKMAGPTVEFVTNADDEMVARHFAAAEAFIFPTNVEDFGITPVEAMAAGTPVIALRAGGPLDYVVEGKTGLFFDKSTVASLKKALLGFPNHNFDSHKLITHARQFSAEVFHQKITDFIKRVK